MAIKTIKHKKNYIHDTQKYILVYSYYLLVYIII